jgi:hypothetical protein
VQPSLLLVPPTDIELLLLPCAACAVPVPSLVTTIQLIFALVVVYSLQVRRPARQVHAQGDAVIESLPLDG